MNHTQPRVGTKTTAALGALVAALALTTTGLGTTSSAQAASISPPAKDSSFVKDFRTGNRSTGAMFRWWWPASVDAAVAVQQLREVKTAGYAGVEIAFVMDGTNYVVDPDDHEYGDANWRAAVKAVLAEANRLDLQVDLTLGGRWPAAVPGLDVDSDAASQELATGDVTVAGGQTVTGPAPQPSPRTYEDRTVDNGVVQSQTRVTTPTLVTATAAKCLSACETNRPQLDLTTVMSLDEHIVAGEIEWTAPTQGTWIVTGYWKRGTAQRNDAPFGNTVSPLSDPESRVVNHFNTAGTTAILDFFGGLLDSETRTLLRANGGSLFEDSLELSGLQLWTPEFLGTFERVNGYSVTRYLPVLAKLPAPNPFAPNPSAYSFAQGQDEMAERVFYDAEQTLNVLYRDQHVAPIMRWAHELGLDFRAQAYGEAIDLGEAASYLDITECETLGCSEGQFRTAAAGVALAGKQLLSTEMLPGGFGNLYGLTPAEIASGEVLPDGTERRGVNREFSFGMNHVVFHGLPYPTIPPSADGTIRDSAADWPGFHAFSSAIGEAFGPRQPTWGMERDISGYYARAQRAMRIGILQLDVAVMNTSLTDTSSDGAPLSADGFSYGYVTPGSLRGHNVSGGVLDPTGPAFQALVVAEDAIDVDTARQIARMVDQGLQVVVVGEGPRHTLSYAASPVEADAQDELLRGVVAEILASPNAHRVPAMSAVPTTLRDLAIDPAAAVGDPAVKAVHRRDRSMDVYMLVNRSSEDAAATVSLEGPNRQVPYLLDPWSGNVTPIGLWSKRDGRFDVTVDIEAGSTSIVVLGKRRLTGQVVSPIHTVATTADDATWTKSGLVLRADEDGAFVTHLSNGRTVRTKVSGVEAPQQIGKWDLRLDEWLPGEADEPSSVTRHKIHDLKDVGLESWTAVPELEHAVGVGTYTTTLTASKELAQGQAVLHFSDVGGAYQVFVNGDKISTPDQLGTHVDLGGALRAGTNTIEVKVASTLLNRLRVHRPAEFGSRPPTVNGLIGPVTLDPYKIERD